MPKQHDPVNHPDHYTEGGIETIDFIEAKKLCYHLGNAVKYISRAGKKDDEVQDLRKAIWYLERKCKILNSQSTESERMRNLKRPRLEK